MQVADVLQLRPGPQSALLVQGWPWLHRPHTLFAPHTVPPVELQLKGVQLDDALTVHSRTTCKSDAGGQGVPSPDGYTRMGSRLHIEQQETREG